MVSFGQSCGVSFITEQTLPQLPGNGGRPLHYETLRRWWRHGVRGVHLETKPFGGKRVSSLEAIDRFMHTLAVLEGQPDEEPIVTAPRLSEEDKKLVALCRNKNNF
jgi:hypothetical protein